MKICVLGSTGMLGHKMVERLRAHYSSVIGLSREYGFNAAEPDSVNKALQVVGPDVIVNCVGYIKQRPQDLEESMRINYLLPHLLQRTGAYVIHFSTDCVFSGKRGWYTEQDPTDPEDAYGKTKALGEIGTEENFLTLRTSIIGRELRNHHGLLDWFLSLPSGATVKGFTQAIWSGVTTNWLADTVAKLLDGPRLSGLYQVAAPPVSKFHLLQMFEAVYNREIWITPAAEPFCDRSLDGTRFAQATGIVTPPLSQLITEQRDQDKGLYDFPR